jgi:hypothetical protein
MKRNSLERQLGAAQSRLNNRNAQLQSAGVADEARATDPAWRSLDARRRQIITQLGSVKKIEDREAAALARKAESGQSEGADEE